MRLPAYILVCLLLVLGYAGCSEGQDEADMTPPVQGEQATSAERASEAAAPQAEVPNDGRTVASRLDDASTGARVELALADANGLSAYVFETEVEDGRVVLQGDVRTRDEYERAASVASEVDGVDDVVNRITVGGQEVARAEPEPVEADTASPEVAERDTSSEPEQEEPAEAEPEEDQGTYHTVRSGESLWAIARQYDVSIGDIRRINNLRGDNIQPGDELRIK